MDGQDSPSLPRYCTKCGEIFDVAKEQCPNCFTRWPRRLPVNRVEAYTLLLTEITELRRAATIDDGTYATLRGIYEQRLVSERPARRFVPRPEPALRVQPALPGPAAAGFGPPPPVVRHPPASPARPPRPPRDTVAPLKAWAVHRQADLVLYLGAFMLSVAALIFVDYQGSVLNGLAKSAILGVYTVLFLALGMALRRWERVREAGPIFVGLGAVLTPLNFLMLYTGALRGGDTPQQWVWLGGSAITAGLYFLLAARGFGRLYAVPCGISAMVAWGSLAATLNLPLGWYGAWFLTLAPAAVGVTQTRFPNHLRWAEAAAAVIAGLCLAWAHGHAIAADSTGERLALAASYAAVLATLGLLLREQRTPRGLALVPLAAALLTASFAWALPFSHDAAITWMPAWFALASAGYLGVAAVDAKRAPGWSLPALGMGGAAVLLAHLAVADGDVAERLPAVYGAVFILAAAAWLRWGFPVALGLLPTLGVAFAVSALWASGDYSFEWFGVTLAVAAAGYIGLIGIRSGERDYWRLVAATGAGLGLVAAHTIAAVPGADSGQLPLTYAVVVGAALLDAFLTRQIGGLLVVPLGLGAFGASFLWAIDAAPTLWALPALGIAAAVAAARPLAAGHPALERARWPYALFLALAPMTSLYVYTNEPVVGALSLTAAAGIFVAGAMLSGGAVGRLAGFSGTGAARVERQMLARAGSAFLFGAAGYLADYLALTASEAACIYAGAAVAGWLAVPILRPRIETAEGVLAPIGAGGLIVAALLAYDAPGLSALTLCAGALAAVIATGGSYVQVWRCVAAVVGAIAIVFAHNHAAVVLHAGNAWELPVAYGAIFAAAALDLLRNRYRPALLALPLLATMTAGSALWAAGIGAELWALVPVTIAAVSLGADRLWRADDWVSRAAYPLLAGLGLVVVGFGVPFESAPFAGALAFAGGGVVWLALGERPNSSSAALFDIVGARAIRTERLVFRLGATALGLAAVAHLNNGLELAMVESAWVFATLGAAGYVMVALVGRRSREMVAAIFPGATAAMLIGLGASLTEPGHASPILALAAVASVVSLLGTREPLTVLLTVAYAAASAAFAWAQVDWPVWSLGIAYGLAAMAIYAAVLGVDVTRVPHGRYAAGVLQVAPVLLALAVVAGALLGRVNGLAPGASAASTAEWRALAAVVAMAGTLLLAEGYLRRDRLTTISATLVLMLAIELGIGAFQPVTVQAYTVPAALYVLALGLTFRRSDEVVPRHLLAHELLFVLGALILFLPPAEQSFEPGGGYWGLVILAEALAMLAVGIALSQRWLVVSAVIGAVSVAARFFTSGEGQEHVPYWLSLGVSGLALLGVGMLLLLAREWWDRTRERLGHWWLESPTAG